MRLFPIILCCAVQAVQGYDGPPPLTEVDGRSPIRMGGELLGGYRSDYIHRGEKLGPNSVEGQISGGASLSDSWAVSGELFVIRNWQGRNFSQTTLHGELQYYLADECTAGLFVNGQWYDSCPLKTGVEPGLSLKWNPMPSWSFSGSFLYDSGQEGVYSQWGVTWQPLLCESVAMVNTVSLGFSHDYLGRNGLKELMVRTGARWAVSGSLRLEPFLGWYCGYGRDDFKKVVLGLWCSYVF